MVRRKLSHDRRLHRATAFPLYSAEKQCQLAVRWTSGPSGFGPRASQTFASSRFRRATALMQYSAEKQCKLDTREFP